MSDIKKLEARIATLEKKVEENLEWIRSIVVIGLVIAFGVLGTFIYMSSSTMKQIEWRMEVHENFKHLK